MSELEELRRDVRKDVESLRTLVQREREHRAEREKSRNDWILRLIVITAVLVFISQTLELWINVTGIWK
jgi:hypothetical protein